VESQPGIGTTVAAEVALSHPLGVRPDFAEKEENRPSPTSENWAWLGQKLTIPVGQTWPWLPADQVNLRRPMVEATDGSPLNVKYSSSLLGLLRGYVIQGQRGVLARIHCGITGYEWEMLSASWALRRIRGVSGRMVLTRNGQPMAAMQPQGRMLHTWNEIVYDGRGYRLSYVKGKPGGYVLVDEANDTLLKAEGSDPDRFELCRALPLPLLVMVTMRIADEVIVESEETSD